ncbi:hypothetical protein TWF103_008467 [Orbilia oligospora]|nr:hypothetical protein TWF103_008467 [Orbilia oligospora]
MSRIPTISFEDENWVVNLVRLLNHLLRFQQLRSIRSLGMTKKDLLDPQWFYFRARVEGRGSISPYAPPSEDIFISGEPFKKTFRVSEGVRLVFSFSIREFCPGSFVYVSFYTFNASWGIYRLHPGHGQPFLKVTKSTPQEFKLQMMIPPKIVAQDPDEVTDIVRAYVSTVKSSWENILLPGLPDSALFLPSTVNSPSAFDSTDPDFKSPPRTTRTYR